MERQSTSNVRCLYCGTVYEQPSEQEQAPSCPNCGYVGWIALKYADASHSGKDD